MRSESSKVDSTESSRTGNDDQVALICVFEADMGGYPIVSFGMW